MKPSFKDCVDWLKKRGALDKFRMYVRIFQVKTLKEWYDECDENYNFINDAFNFNDTEEGFDYWNDIKNEFLGL